ncbi:MAG: DUF1194 domain-containing protein [Alphaproteobacteria bacterium]
MAVRLVRIAAFVAAALAATPVAHAEDIPVDLELVLAVDVSWSVDPMEARLQREGYIAALRHPRVAAAIAAGPYQRIALAYMEWAGTEHVTTVIGWRAVDSAAALEDVAQILAQAPVIRARRTAPGAAIEAATAMLLGNGFAGERMVIDVSGDGIANAGPSVAVARDRAVEAGIVINGLPIVTMAPTRLYGGDTVDLVKYYRECVTGGPGSFVVVADDFVNFAEAILKKLILEIAQAPRAPVRRHGLLWQAQATQRSTPPPGFCDTVYW